MPDRVSIDVDGAELSILKGARQTLQDPRLQEVQMEAVDFTEQNEISDSIIFFEQSGLLFLLYFITISTPLGAGFSVLRKKIA